MLRTLPRLSHRNVVADVRLLGVHERSLMEMKCPRPKSLKNEKKCFRIEICSKELTNFAWIQIEARLFSCFYNYVIGCQAKT